MSEWLLQLGRWEAIFVTTAIGFVIGKLIYGAIVRGEDRNALDVGIRWGAWCVGVASLTIYQPLISGQLFELALYGIRLVVAFPLGFVPGLFFGYLRFRRSTRMIVDDQSDIPSRNPDVKTDVADANDLISQSVDSSVEFSADDSDNEERKNSVLREPENEDLDKPAFMRGNRKIESSVRRWRKNLSQNS